MYIIRHILKQIDIVKYNKINKVNENSDNLLTNLKEVLILKVNFLMDI